MPLEVRQEIVGEYEKEARHGTWRSLRVLTCDHTGTIGTHSLGFLQLRSGQAVHALAKGPLLAGQALRAPTPLFKKLDESLAEEDYAGLSWRYQPS